MEVLYEAHNMIRMRLLIGSLLVHAYCHAFPRILKMADNRCYIPCTFYHFILILMLRLNFNQVRVRVRVRVRVVVVAYQNEEYNGFKNQSSLNIYTFNVGIILLSLFSAIF